MRIPRMALRRRLKQRKWAKKINESCPKGGVHEWDIAAHGPGGSSFDCMKCGEIYP